MTPHCKLQWKRKGEKKKNRASVGGRVKWCLRRRVKKKETEEQK